jgi:hypothetical protein
MERSNPQYLPNKNKSKKLETECNQKKQEKTKLQPQSQQDTEQYQQLFKKTDDLQEGQVFSHYFFKKSHRFHSVLNCLHYLIILCF